MILVVGYGNPLRSDDGVGMHIVDRISKSGLHDVETRIMQQLHIEIVDDLAKYQQVIFVDAASEGAEIELRKVELTDRLYPDSSHHMSPELFMSLAASIYGTPPDVFVCTVRGEHFEFGSALSDEVQRRAEQAIQMVKSLIFRIYQYA